MRTQQDDVVTEEDTITRFHRQTPGFDVNDGGGGNNQTHGQDDQEQTNLFSKMLALENNK